MCGVHINENDREKERRKRKSWISFQEKTSLTWGKIFHFVKKMKNLLSKKRKKKKGFAYLMDVWPPKSQTWNSMFRWRTVSTLNPIAVCTPDKNKSVLYHCMHACRSWLFWIHTALRERERNPSDVKDQGDLHPKNITKGAGCQLRCMYRWRAKNSDGRREDR